MSDRLVTVASYTTPEEASLARNWLEEFGIRAYLADQSAAGVASHLVNAIGGVKLQVASSDETAARTALTEDASEWESDDAGEVAPDLAEPAEIEPPLSAVQQNAERAYRAALIGIALLPLQFYACWLLLKVAWSKEPLDAASRQKATVAAIVAVPLSLLLLAFGRSMFVR